MKTIRIIATRDAAGSHFRNGLVAAIAPHFNQEADAGNKEAMDKFKAAFPQQLTKGMAIDFAWARDGTLIISVDDKVVSSIPSGAFSKAFFTVYLGEKSKTGDAKKEWAKGVAKLLHQQ